MREANYAPDFAMHLPSPRFDPGWSDISRKNRLALPSDMLRRYHAVPTWTDKDVHVDFANLALISKTPELLRHIRAVDLDRAEAIKHHVEKLNSRRPHGYLVLFGKSSGPRNKRA